MATILAILIAYVLLTFAHVVLGELVPKGIALRHSEGMRSGCPSRARVLHRVRAGDLDLRVTTDAILKLFGVDSSGAERTSSPRPSCGCSSRVRRSRARSKRKSSR